MFNGSRLSRLVSLLLSIVLSVSLLPVSALADCARGEHSALLDAADTADSVRPLEENVSARSEYIKEFSLGGGMSLASVYPTAVHFASDGKWEEIDNTLKFSNENNAYHNTAGVWDISLPEKLSIDTPIAVAKDGYGVSFCIDKAVYDSESPEMSPAEGKVTRPDFTEEKAAMEYPETFPEKIYSQIVYENVFPLVLRSA